MHDQAATARQAQLLQTAALIPYAQLSIVGHEALQHAILANMVVGVVRSARGDWHISLNHTGPFPISNAVGHIMLRCDEFERIWPTLRGWPYRQEPTQ